MNDAQIEEIKERIGPLINRWVRPLGLMWWNIDVEYHRENRPDDPDCAMDCAVRWEYMRAIIGVYPSAHSMADERLEASFLHELQHIFLNETREWERGNAMHHEEHVAQMYTKAFLWLRDHLTQNTETQNGI